VERVPDSQYIPTCGSRVGPRELANPRTAASWPLVPHTGAKLALLQAYHGAWFPILSRGTNFERIIYIDGFAGPGRYTAGEDGSPIIALKAALGAHIRLPFEFHFVERRRRAVNCLNANIDELRQQQKIASTTEINVHAQLTFERAYDRTLRQRLVSSPRAPAFALLDPFGWTGLPMRIMTELVRRSNTELVVNFMFEEINRFLNHPEQEKTLTGYLAVLIGAADTS
jgi:three-Cys-motif partner protein